jgi:hypothetical protein
MADSQVLITRQWREPTENIRISELHIGLKGTMGAFYLKNLTNKTRHGLRGQVEQGK